MEVCQKKKGENYEPRTFVDRHNNKRERECERKRKMEKDGEEKSLFTS